MSVDSPNILIISVGGVITQFLEKSETGHPKIVTADVQKLKTRIVGKDGNNIELFERDLKGINVRVTFEELDRDFNGLEERDSAQVNPNIWASIVEKIQKNNRHYNGFVVLHGLDTLAYTASAVSFMIRNPNFPIVFTGSQRALNFVRSDALQNIFSSITIAAGKSLGLPAIPEVTIFLHDTLYRANRTSMSSATSYKAFTSLNYPILASVGEHIDIANHLINKNRKQAADFYDKVDAKVEIIDVFPGMTSGVIEGLIDGDNDINILEQLKDKSLEFENRSVEEGNPKYKANEICDLINDAILNISKEAQIAKLLDKLPKEFKQVERNLINILKKRAEKKRTKVKGVILRTYGMGTAPTSPDVLAALNSLHKSGVFIQNVTQAHSSRVSFNADPVSLRLYENGIISGLDMTAESAFAKMVTVLSNYKNIEKGVDHCENKLQENIAGEQSQSIKSFHFKEGVLEKNKDFSNEGNDGFFVTKLISTSKGEFEFQDISKIKNIQVRILGLKKEGYGAEIALKLLKIDDEIIDLDSANKIEIVKKKRIPWNKNNVSINQSFDITENKAVLFGKDSKFYISSDGFFSWKKISLQVYYI